MFPRKGVEIEDDFITFPQHPLPPRGLVGHEGNESGDII